MRFVTFAHPGGEAALGVQVGGAVLDLSAASGREPAFDSMLDMISSGEEALRLALRLADAARGDPEGSRPNLFDSAAVDLLAPIPRPRKNVFCVGLNFRSHVEQNAIALGQPIEIPEVPLFFTKTVTAVVGTGRGIRCDERLTQKLDYEVELAVVIGVGGSWIAPEDAMAHVFGFTLVNDVSARDLQWRTSQFFYGKGLDSFCPMGPAIVTPEELGSIDDIVLELLVDGEMRQHERAGNMIFSPAVAIAELSKGITLEPGDVISLGTPGGCGYQIVPPVFLRPGNVVECRAEGIGSLVNPVVHASIPTFEKRAQI